MSERPTHEAAKNQLARWLAKHAGEHTTIHVEYPIGINGNNELVGLDGWPGNTPTFDELNARGMDTYVRFDVALLHRGILRAGYEVVWTSDIKPEKKDRLKRIKSESKLSVVHRVSARWITDQPHPNRSMPDRVPVFGRAGSYVAWPDFALTRQLSREEEVRERQAEMDRRRADPLTSYADRLFDIEQGFADNVAEYGDCKRDIRAEIKARAGETGVAFDLVSKLVRARMRETETAN